jgi:hypothetical protein
MRAKIRIGNEVVTARPTSDYPVGVYRQERFWSDAPTAALYMGIFWVTLNHHVDLRFVPDISNVAPPWDGHQLPPFEELQTVQQARLFAALESEYLVTPNDALAGSEEPLPPPELTDDDLASLKADGIDLDLGDEDKDWESGTVFYVTAAEFDRYAVDLNHLAERTRQVPLRALSRVSELRDLTVIDFLKHRVVASSLLNSWDMEWLTGPPPRRRWWR